MFKPHLLTLFLVAAFTFTSVAHVEHGRVAAVPVAAAKGLDLGKELKHGLSSIGDWVKKNVKALKTGKGWLDLLETFMPGIRIGGDLVQLAYELAKRSAKIGFGPAVKSLWEGAKQKLEDIRTSAQGDFEKLFGAFDKVLTLDAFKLAAIEDFAKTVSGRVSHLVKTLCTALGLGGILTDITASLSGAVASAAITPAAAGLAAVSFGLKRVLTWIIPKLLFGMASVAAKVEDKLDAAEAKYKPKGFDAVKDTLVKAVGIAAGGLIDTLVKDEQVKARIQAVVAKVADVAGKVQGALNTVLAGVAKAAGEGSVDELQKALDGSPSIEPKLTQAESGKVMGEVIVFLKDLLWDKFEPKLRALIQKALSVVDRLLDVPRNALAAAVGTIPFAGGVLAGALNFGMGFIVDLIKNAIIKQVERIAKNVLDDVVADVRDAVAKKFATASGAKAAAGFIDFAKRVADVAGTMQAAGKAATDGLKAGLGSLIVMGIKTVIGKGVAHTGLRALLIKAVDGVATAIAQKKVKFGEVVAQVLKSIAKPAAKLIADQIPNPKVAGIVAPVAEKLIGGLAGANLMAALKDPKGVLHGLGKLVYDTAKPQLDAALKVLGQPADAARLGARIAEEGINALLSPAAWSELLAAGKAAK